jgi:hypothetical protein
MRVIAFGEHEKYEDADARDVSLSLSLSSSG